MEKHNKIISDLKEKYLSDNNVIAFLLTGSVAREEASESSDLDIILITKESRETADQYIDGILVEIKSKTSVDYIQKMVDKPMNVYMWLDAEVIFDKQNISEKVISKAKEIYENFTPNKSDVKGTVKWLESVKGKISSAQERNDKLAIGFNVSNVLWIIIQGFYFLNSKPLPPSTTAFRNISKLEKLPENFNEIWETILTSNLKERTSATMFLINYLINNLK